MNIDSLFLCLNAETGKIPAKVQLLPAGPNIIGKDGRRWTAHNPQAIADATNADLKNHVIDENHATDHMASRGKSAPAMGWFSNVRAESDGTVWADVEWTEKGKQAVASLEYRYLSPAFLSGEGGEITKILRAALTNAPNLAITSLNSQNNPETEKEKNSMKQVLLALGLAENATEQDAITAIGALKTQLNAQKPVDLTAYAPRADLMQMEQRAVTAETALKDLNAQSLASDAKKAVDEAVKNKKIAPASKEAYLSMCSSREGLANFQAIMEKTPALIPAGPAVPEGAPLSGEAVSLNAEDVAFARAAGYSEEEFKKVREGK